MLTHFMNLSSNAQAITVSSSSISAACSLLIISIILRCPSKLSSNYHKIMFSLSFWDTLSSMAMALTTLPMSKDILGLYVYDTVPEALEPYLRMIAVGGGNLNFEPYDFNGVVLGNGSTCAAQGFAIYTGHTFAIYSNIALCIYYVCTIRYKMTEETVRKKLLPIMAGVSCLIVIPYSLYPLIIGNFTPTTFMPYCVRGDFPYLCRYKGIIDFGFEIPDCIGGNVPLQSEAIYGLVALILLGLYFIIMIGSLVLVVISVFQNEIAIRRQLKEEKEAEEEHGEIEMILTNNNEADAEPHMNLDLPDQQRPRRISRSNFQASRTVLRLALMYIIAFFMTWIWTFMIVALPTFSPDQGFVKALQVGHIIFHPSQGFLNAFIFVYNKVCFARQAIPNLSFSHALKMVILSPSEVPEAIVSSLDVVHEDMKKKEEQMRIQELIEEEEEEEENVSALFPVSTSSMPSDFPSIETPSCAPSNAVSSQGVINKELKEEINHTRQFYTNTPDKFLEFRGDTLAAAWTLDQDPGQNSARIPASSPEGGNYDHTKIAVPPSKGSAGENDMSGASSVYTSRSLLSGFSSALADPSTQTNISEEGGEEASKMDQYKEDDHDREAGIQANHTTS